MKYARLAAAIFLMAGSATGVSAADSKAMLEDYIREPLPAGIQVMNSEFEGAVFADENGHTLYRIAIAHIVGRPAEWLFRLLGARRLR